MTGIPDELVRVAGEAIEDEAMRLTGKDFGTIHRDTITRAALEAVGLPALLERVRAAEGAIARVEALIESDGGVFLKSDTKIKRVQEDRRRDLGAIVTTSMVTVADLRAALTEGEKP